MRRLRVTSAVFAALLAVATAVAPAAARPAEVDALASTAEEVGSARYRVFAWTVFHASLWTESGSFSWDEPFALSLTYARAFTAEALAARSVMEMESRGYGDADALEPLRERLVACFADVEPGDRITGLSLGGDEARFYVNGAESCALESPGFRRAFFGIWLDNGRASAKLIERDAGR